MFDSKVYYKEYYLKNKDKIKAYNKEYFKEYNLKNKDKYKEYHLKNKDREREKNKQYYLKHKDEWKVHNKEYNLKSYGTTIEQKEYMRMVQNNSCDICSNIFKNDNDCGVDHTHRYDENGKELPCATEDIRGLLCQKCNHGIGLFKDNIVIITNAINYLKTNYDNGVFINSYKVEVKKLKTKLRLEQNDCCTICNNKFKNDYDCCLDHTHKTNKIRKVLCRTCNGGLGSFNDDTILLQKAIDYLNKSPNILKNKINSFANKGN